MNIMIIGRGAREHALGWGVKRSPKCGNIFFVPGNAGTELIGTNLQLSLSDNDAVLNAAKAHNIDLVIVGAEAPLAKGIVNAFHGSDIPILGPSLKSVLLESSKSWAKSFMERHNIPQAKGRLFTSLKVASEYLKRLDFPVVIKADGLASGKGVVVVSGIEEGGRVLEEFMLGGSLGQAGKKVVIEEYLTGVECSIFLLLDGNGFTFFGAARDYKKALDGDKGENTGGMGAVSYPSLVSDTGMIRINDEIINPTINGLKKEDLMYRGFLYIGLMLTENGPKVLEYNVRLGDPETQVVIPRLKENMLEWLWSAANGSLLSGEIVFDNRAACGVVVAKEGYPGSYSTGQPITIFNENLEFLCFQAATERNGNKVVNCGGRTLTLVGLGSNIFLARARIYNEIEQADLSGYVFRKDIAAAMAGVLG